MRYAQISADTGMVVVLLDGDIKDWPDLDAAGVLVPCSAEVEAGWVWDGKAFAPPPSATAGVVTSLEFRRRFTPAERRAITLAAAESLREGSSILQEWIDDLSAASTIDLKSVDLREGIDLLVYFGFIDAKRATELLA